jgi:hypothetical protein
MTMHGCASDGKTCQNRGSTRHARSGNAAPRSRRAAHVRVSEWWGYRVGLAETTVECWPQIPA